MQHFLSNITLHSLNGIQPSHDTLIFGNPALAESLCATLLLSVTFLKQELEMHDWANRLDTIKPIHSDTQGKRGSCVGRADRAGI